MTTRLETIRKKLYQLIETDKDFKIFGSNEPWNGHQYQINPTLSEKDLSGFEDYMKIRLPDQYRTFLAAIGDGGAGPFYGLYSLSEAIDMFGLAEDSTQQDYINCFTEFSITKEESALFLSKLLSLNDGRKVYFDRDDYPEQVPLIGEYSLDRGAGFIYLSQYGCGGYYVLVVQGNCYGQVWYREEGRMAPLCDSNGTIFSFFDWYEYWLDTSLKKLLAS